jgi:hypothetical protein
LLLKSPEKFIDQVVPHECAHLVVYELFGTRIKPHGYEWKSVMEGIYQLNPQVYHDFDVSHLGNKPYIYRCACPDTEMAFGAKRHANVKRGDAYICQACKKTLTFVYKRKEEEPRENNEKNLIDGLYLFSSNGFLDFNEQMQKRVNYVLNKKKPLNVFSSPLEDTDLFFRFLSKKGLKRKYQGEYLFEDLKVLSEENRLSHLLLMVESLGFLKEEDLGLLKSLSDTGVVIRTLK